MSLSFSTKSLIAIKEVEIDGNKFKFREAGAGAVLELNRITRDGNEFATRSKNGTVTTEDTNKQLENFASILEIYGTMLFDGTKNNAKVKAWLAATPPDVIVTILQQIRESIS